MRASNDPAGKVVGALAATTIEALGPRGRSHAEARFCTSVLIPDLEGRDSHLGQVRISERGPWDCSPSTFECGELGKTTTSSAISRPVAHTGVVNFKDYHYADTSARLQSVSHRVSGQPCYKQTAPSRNGDLLALTGAVVGISDEVLMDANNRHVCKIQMMGVLSCVSSELTAPCALETATDQAAGIQILSGILYPQDTDKSWESTRTKVIRRPPIAGREAATGRSNSQMWFTTTRCTSWNDTLRVCLLSCLPNTLLSQTSSTGTRTSICSRTWTPPIQPDCRQSRAPMQVHGCGPCRTRQSV